MIECFINGKRAIPSLSDDIKLTRENPYIKKSDSYTYDIIFPLSIPENISVFGALNRIDVSVKSRVFEECILYCNNYLVIRGSGTITRLNEKEVRMQILSGVSSVNYRSEFGNIYIDRIPYMEIADKYKQSETDVSTELTSKHYIGVEGKYIFQLTRISGTDGKFINSYTNSIVKIRGRAHLLRKAVQPSLMYVLKTVLEYMGYSVNMTEFNRKPWTDLYIANATRTFNIAQALPHWTVKTFLEEFRKLFNCSYIFDEMTKSVNIVPYYTNDTSDVVEIETIDEFESNYDEDGVEFLGSSNIGYALSSNHENNEDISRSVMAKFPVREFTNIRDLEQWMNNTAEQEVMTTFMHLRGATYFYYAKKTENGYSKGWAGDFRPLFRNLEAENQIDLKIVPVAIKNGSEDDIYDFPEFHGDSSPYVTTFHELRNVHLPIADEHSDRVEEGEYVTIEEAIEESADTEREETEDDSSIEIMFATDPLQYYSVNGIEGIDFLPIVKTATYYYDYDYLASLSLNPVYGYKCIGDFHQRGIKIDTGTSIDGNNELCFKFLFDGIPDPTKKYNIHNKMYLCSKVEVKITKDGEIDRLKTGYFYEIL